MRNKPHRLTVAEAIQKSTEYLRSKGIDDSPRLDAELLLARILNCDRTRLYMDWQKPLTELEVAAYRDFIRRRGQEREPVSHILGRRQFYGREFEVTPDTLSPRPETEGLVDRALDLLRADTVLSTDRQVIFEIGTGTGCIIISLAAESDAHQFIATDIMPAALAVARRNAHRHGMEGRIEFRLGDCFADFEGSCGLVISNPPYIRRGDLATLPPEVVRFDPTTALDGGEDGLEIIRRIVAASVHRLCEGGLLLMEIGEDQGADVAALLADRSVWSEARVEKDFEGCDRYVLARRV
jgi:release factor glutamine methyltransferase